MPRRARKASREKAKAVVEELRSMKRKEAAKKMDDGIEEPLTYCDFSNEHWTFIRTNKVVERLNREIRAVSGSRQFPRRQLCPHADPCPAAPCGPRSMGPQEVQKHDALGGSHRLLCCWLTSFIPDSENYLALPPDAVFSDVRGHFMHA